MRNITKAALCLAILTALTVTSFGQRSLLDRIDPLFDPNIVANLYGGKTIEQLEVYPDGKILAFGTFNSYNRVMTGKLVRLNADGSLDTTFNNQTITASNGCNARGALVIQPDGKIVVTCRDMVANGQPAKNVLRLNADGTLDTSFNYTLGGTVTTGAVDSLGRVAIFGNFQTPQGTRTLIRLNADGSYDASFTYGVSQSWSTIYLATQGSRVIVGGSGVNSRILRLNENGSEDTTFALSLTGQSFSAIRVRPDNKIVWARSTALGRINENGGNDSTFQPTTFSSLGGQATMKLAADGKIILTRTANVATYYRFLADGGEDPSFTPYTHTPSAQGVFTIQPDGSLILGDSFEPTQSINNFIRLTPAGAPDPTFNPGGLGFQNILPGSIRAIEPLPDGKVYLGGKFDVINDLTRPKIVRLNADASVDPSFQINTTPTGNYFVQVRDVYHLQARPDGKLVVSGWFDYVQDGVGKKNVVRLNPDGSIDSTFNLMVTIDDWSVIVGAGQNRMISLSDGKLLIGNSTLNGFGQIGPLKFNQDGSQDTSFTSMLNLGSANMWIDDLVLQPDGKIVVGGSVDPSNSRSYVARLNSNGSMDTTFPYTEEPGRLRPTLALLPNGKIIVGRHTLPTTIATVKRLNADGTLDTSFNTFSIPNGIINDVLVLENGKIFVGGKFTVTINGQESRNLVRLDANGNIEPTVYDINADVLALALDSEGRLLVGGSFTVINTNGSLAANRTYVARLTDSVEFDYDGDGKDDVSVFRPSENKWYIFRSSDFTIYEPIFAIPGDVPTPADYDGDSKTDVAIFRPSVGDWWYLASTDGSYRTIHWGAAGDIPRPSDFDGDGKADAIIFRESENNWYRHGSTGTISVVSFGAAGDKPLTGDFDGDGKSDPAVYRPSTGVWWYRSSINGSYLALPWGISTDIPAPADFDGDGKTDFAVYRASVGAWHIYHSGTGQQTLTGFGLAGDKPVPADYDGDGKSDIAVFRPSTGVWYVMRSTAGFAQMQFGVSTDIPTENAFVP